MRGRAPAGYFGGECFEGDVFGGTGGSEIVKSDSGLLTTMTGEKRLSEVK